MSGLMWRIRQFISNLVPIAVVCALIYGGWTLYRQGTFRHGLKPAIVHTLGKIPYFGSRIRYYASGKEFAKSSGKKHSKKHSRRSGRKRHRR